MILQLDPPLPLVTPKGAGLAHLVIDYGCEHHLIWVVFLDEGGQCWAFPNREVRMEANVTMGRAAGCHRVGNRCRDCLGKACPSAPDYDGFSDKMGRAAT